MKTEDIKTWESRITPASSDDDIISYKQTEIDELRAALKERDAEIAELAEFVVAVGGFWGESKSRLVGENSLAECINQDDTAPLKAKIDTQRAVMQQALLQLEADYYVLRNSLKIADAIAALKEQLK